MRNDVDYYCHAFLRRHRCATAFSWFSISVAVLVSLILVDVAWADDPPPPRDRSKKMAAWKPELLEPGRGWWCYDGVCSRERDDCERFGKTCTRQRRAWAYSYWGVGDTSGTWIVGVHGTRADCTDEYDFLLTVEPTAVAVSPCTSVGDKRAPARKRAKLPRGKGWWCMRWKNPFSADETSTCLRKQSECEEGSARITSSAMSRVAGRIEVTRDCQPATAAWASEVGGSEPTFMVFETETDCGANLLGDACKKVK